jgi:hypothetical protein
MSEDQWQFILDTAITLKRRTKTAQRHRQLSVTYKTVKQPKLG